MALSIEEFVNRYGPPAWPQFPFDRSEEKRAQMKADLEEMMKAVQDECLNIGLQALKNSF